MKNFFKKRWVRYVCLIIAAVAVTAVVSRLTNGYNDWAPDEVFAVRLNEENYFFDTIEDREIYDNLQVSAVAENGTVLLNGSIADSSPSTIDLSSPIDLGSLTLPAGTYTFTCFKDASYKSYYAVGTYTVAGYTHTWYADFENAPNNTAGSELLHGRTITLDEETVVTFQINLVEGAELKNVKARPVIVEGEEAGSYHANGLFG